MENMSEEKAIWFKDVISEALDNENVEVKAKNISTEGANYLGELFLLDVDQDGEETLKLFAKVSNIPAEARVYVPINDIYKNEITMYTTVAKEFNELQEKHNIPLEKRFIFPKYYGSSLKPLSEMVILENLADKGYVMYDRFESLDWEFAKASVEEIAKFHALSFVLKKENPDKFELLTKEIKNNFFENPASDPEQLMNMARAKAQVVDDEYKDRVMKFIDDSKNTVFLQHVKSNSRYSVIVHGDYRSSNMLVKYEGDSIVSLKPVDYQTAMYGNPVSDLIYLLYTGTDQEFRKNYFEQFIEHYHNSLKYYLQLMSYDINDIFPKSAFYFELKDRLPYGLEIGLFLLPTVLVEPEDRVEMGEMVSEEVLQESFGNMKPSKIFVKRINEIVKEFAEWGILPEVEKAIVNGTAGDEEICTEKLKSNSLTE